MIKQVVAFVENQKGIMWQMTAALRKKGIRICGMSTVDSPEFGIVRMIVDQPEDAIRCLTETGIVVKACEVIAVALSKSEEMEAVLQVVQDGNVNLNYFYSSFGGSMDCPLLILNAADMDETEAMLLGHGFACLDSIN
ncbi:MAG: hypothetical protein LUG93_07270 [Lachnospiraceae bacterium]|nr:hypothetical protein [Lachnospiraceae bacterium]